MNEIDDRIFFSEDIQSPTTTSTTTKKIFKQTSSAVPEKKKWAMFEFFRIMNIGMKDVEMEPSDMRKYESWALNIKAGLIALSICSILLCGVFASSIGSEKYREEKEPTYIDMAIDYFYPDKKEQPLQTKSVVVVKDTIVPLDSVQYLLYQNDSLLKAAGK